MVISMQRIKSPFRYRLTKRQVIIASALLPLFAATYFAAYWLRFDGIMTRQEIHHITVTIGWVVLVKAFTFAWFGVYQGWSRYLNFHDLLDLVKAASVSSLIVAFGDYLFFPDPSVPRSVFLTDWGTTVFTVGGIRAVMRLIDEGLVLTFMNQGKTPVFIAGVNDSGEALLRAIRRNSKWDYQVVGFITQDASALKTRIDGVPVVGMLDETCELAEKFGVSEVLITAGEFSGQQVRALVDSGRTQNVTVKVLPSYEQLIHGHVDLRPRPVSIEDLLCRDPVELDLGELHHWIEDRVLMVTGSAGSIGSEICRQLLQFSPTKLILVDQSETGQFFLERELRSLAPHARLEVCIGDVCDRDRMHFLFSEHRPEIVFHAAAYKHVPLMESNPSEAVKAIPVASRLLADLAHEHRVDSFVMISTDKAVNPTSVMGACKRVAELYVQALAANSDCRFVTVRFGNVLDSAGSVLPVFREQIAKGGPVTVTHPDMKRYFMTIPEASQLVIQAGAMGRGGEIFVLDMGEPVRIADLATDMIRLSGLRVGEDVHIEFTGVRPGEKLFEELHTSGELHLPTNHNKILVARCVQTDYRVISSLIDHLEEKAHDTRDEILQTLQQIVPEYQTELSKVVVKRMQRRAA
jgi:FlaA1/EpsC-like NDP-sugar epimerase